MNRRTILLAVAAVILICFGIFKVAMMLARDGRFSTAAQTGGDPNQSPDGRTDSKTSRNAPKFKDPRLRQLYDRVTYFFPITDFDNYLEKNGRNGRSLAAVLSLTGGDPGVLSELKQHLNEPEALLALAQCDKVADSEKLNYIKLYLDLNPNELQGYLLAAAIKKRLGVGGGEVDAMIQKGITTEGVSQGAVNLTNDMREALISTGLPQTKAEIYLTTNAPQVDSLLLINVEVLQSACEQELKDAKDSTATGEILGKYANVVMSLKEMAALTSSDSQMLNYSYYIKLFGNVDGDVDLGEGLGNAKAFTDGLKQEFKELLSVNKAFNERMMQASPEEVDQYFQNKISMGEAKAKRLMLNLE